MAVRYKIERLMDERFFEDTFKMEMNDDVMDTVFDAFCVAMGVYDEATRQERIDYMAKLLAKYDSADEWLAVANEVRRLREPADDSHGN